MQSPNVGLFLSPIPYGSTCNPIDIQAGDLYVRTLEILGSKHHLLTQFRTFIKASLCSNNPLKLISIKNDNVKCWMKSALSNTYLKFELIIKKPFCGKLSQPQWIKWGYINLTTGNMFFYSTPFIFIYLSLVWCRRVQPHSDHGGKTKVMCWSKLFWFALYWQSISGTGSNPGAFQSNKNVDSAIFEPICKSSISKLG